MPSRISRRRSALDLSKGQTGDVSTGEIAGRDNITHNDPEPWLDFLNQYLWDVDSARTRRDDELAHELAEGRKALETLAREFDNYQRLMANRLAVDAARASANRLFAITALIVATVALGIALL